MAINQNRNSIRVLRTVGGSYLAHRNIPNLAIGTGSDFTIQLWVVTGADMDGVLYSQEGGFSIRLVDGQAVFTLDGFATLRPADGWVLSPHTRSYIAVRYQAGTLTLFLGGLPAAEQTIKAKVAPCPGDYAIGRHFTGGFPLIRVSDTARSNADILADNAAPPAVDSHCVFQSDCSTAQYRDVSANRLPMWAEGRGAGCGIYTACTVFSGRGQVSCTPFEPLSATHTLLLKLRPQPQQRPVQRVYTAMDGAGTLYAVELTAQADSTFQLSLIGDSGDRAVMSRVLLPELWQDVAAVFDGGKVTLYLDGALDGTYAFSFSGKRSDILVGAEDETGRPIYEKGFSGHMAYTAEFGRALSADEIALYADDPPFLFEDGLVSLLPLDWPGAVEAVGATPLRVTGSAPFAMAADVTPRDGDIGCSMRIPTEVSPFWKTLSADEQWALELLASLFQDELTGLCGYARPAEAGGQIPLIRRIAKAFARHHRQGWIQLQKLSPSKFNSKDATKYIAVDLAEPVNTPLAGALGAGGVLSGAAAGGVAGFVSANAGVIVGTLAGAALAALLLAAFISAQRDRPTNDGALKVTGVCWNHRGDPAWGGLHYHKGGPNLPASMTDTPDPDASGLDTLCVLVPSRLATPTVDVTLTYTTTGTDSKTGTLKGCDVPPSYLLGEHAAVYTVAPNASVTVSLTFDAARFPRDRVTKLAHTWELWDGDTHLTNCQCTFYLLPDVPIDPWAVDNGAAYRAGREGYIRLELLDFLIEKGGGHADVPRLCTQALNGCGFFQYDRRSGNPHYTAQTPGVYNSYLLKLEKLISHLKEDAHPINCVDCACIVSACCALAGVSLPMARFWGVLNNSYHSGFICNLMMAIGCPGWATPFEHSAGFLFHQFNVSGHALTQDTPVHDACLKVDGGPYPGSDDVSKKVPLLPLGLPAQETGDPIVHVPVDQPYAGQFYRERLTADGEVCRLTGPITTVVGFCADATPAPESASPMPPAVRAIWERFALDALPETAAAPLERWDAAPLAGATLNESAPNYGDWTVEAGDHGPVWVERRFCATAEETARCMAEVLFNVAHPNVRPGEAEGVSLGERCFLLGTGGVLFCRRGNVFTVSAESMDAALSAAKALDESVQAG